MSLSRLSALHLGLTLGLGLALVPAIAQDKARVITLGGSVTEIAVALGAADRIVGRDTTSNFPDTILALPDVGYIRALSAEGVLSLAPDLIVAEGDAGPPEAVDVLKAAGVPFILAPEATTPDGVVAKVTAVAEALGLPQEGADLAARLTTEFAEVKARADAVAVPKRVLFVLSLQGGRIMAAGAGTEAEGIIRLAGGINAAEGFDGYKQIADEAVITAAPDAILMMDREGELSIADADILAQPALALTPAAVNGAIIRMDGMLLLGFGPRTPEAALALNAALYGAGG
jgi:iron complex transport system substrate-binding protein